MVPQTKSEIELANEIFANKPSLNDLLTLHAQSRGELVNAEKDADTSFSVKNGAPFDLARIASEFLST